MYVGECYRNVPIVSGIVGFIVIGSRLGIHEAWISVVVLLLKLLL